MKLLFVGSRSFDVVVVIIFAFIEGSVDFDAVAYVWRWGDGVLFSW